MHGNSKRKEVCPDGSKDENVFDIQQGVSINLLIRTGTKNNGKLGNVYHTDFYGQRKNKYEALNNAYLNKVRWKKLKYQAPYYFFVPRDYETQGEYNSGFKINETFINYNSGIQTKNDSLTINMIKQDLKQVVTDFESLGVPDIKSKYGFKGYQWLDSSKSEGRHNAK